MGLFSRPDDKTIRNAQRWDEQNRARRKQARKEEWNPKLKEKRLRAERYAKEEKIRLREEKKKRERVAKERAKLDKYLEYETEMRYLRDKYYS